MSIKAARSLMERLNSDRELAKKVTECKDSAGCMVVAKDEGFDCTLEEMKQVSTELSGNDLADAAGGCGNPRPPWPWEKR